MYQFSFYWTCQPSGSILPVSEMQARWACKVFSGQCELPDLKKMRDIADLDWAEHLKRYVPRERTAITVDAIEYMDMIPFSIKSATFTQNALFQRISRV